MTTKTSEELLLEIHNLLKYYFAQKTIEEINAEK